jgi:mannan endo-1,4-beta-mannosidase
MKVTRRETLAGAAALGLTATPAFAQITDPKPGALSNPKASRAAKSLYRYLWSIYGKHTLTGQQESFWTAQGPTNELDYIQKHSGKLPAVLGLDYIDPREFIATTARAIRWHESGGIVSICWHWGVPTIGTGYENSKKDFDVEAAVTLGTPENKAYSRDLNQIAEQLAILRDSGVPVLWRPFHEFSGDWFWWGKHGPETFKMLWMQMWVSFTRFRKLDNLIWVLGYAGQNIDPRYDPGRRYYDVAGADLYVDDHGNLASMFAKVKAIVGNSVPICLHENGPIPDPATLGPEADWLWFLTWHTRWLMDGKQNTPEQIRSYFNSERYLTKDELRFPRSHRNGG